MNTNLEKYIDLIYKYNQNKNITGFKTVEELRNLGINDSIKAMEVAQNIGLDFTNLKIADIGAGAGFPSVPYLIHNYSFDLTIIEGMASRCEFLQSVKQELNLDKLTIVNKRSEDTSELREYFDVITARAVANVKTMFLLTHHLLKVGGYLYLPKGRGFQQEINEFLKSFPDQKNNVQTIEYTNILDEKSTIVVIKKTSKSPKNWPLNWKQIKDYK
ncbi:16S rRNA (guanine(527)-N(7))-methyltransferase RsmG [Mycoplasma simbae]|uniref:16S rRNA (guanine(527)-N(7))-methyltransferase RsmG n=1 Tax=Mycoplasma simbae TaxID=36744 RepID=UPI000A930E1C|nr:16S rRNA (guanine(527)-N(7))-methyltransferase RsmG [Mycoplasma simbae]